MFMGMANVCAYWCRFQPFYWFRQIISQQHALIDKLTLKISAFLQIIHDAEDILIGYSKYLWATGISRKCSRAVRHTIKSAFRLEPWSLACE